MVMDEMNNVQQEAEHVVAVIGAGPSGLFAARELAEQGVRVILLNRDIKPGGLAEYGIYPTKLKMKAGLRNQFHQVLYQPNIEYFGNVRIGDDGDLTLDDLRHLGVQALLVTVGAQSTKWLGLPGEQLRGVYHAKDIVYHYNLLPPFSETQYPVGKRVAIIGVGNVMTDIAHWLIEDQQVESIYAFARRGPAEVKFDRKELENIIPFLDLDDLFAEVERVTPLMQSVGQDPLMFRAMIRGVAAKVAAPDGPKPLRLRFLASPASIIGDEAGQVIALNFEENTMEPTADGDIRARGMGTFETMSMDSIIFAIGDQVDSHVGLPVLRGEFLKNPAPRFPIDGVSYEAFDPAQNEPIGDVFLAGWARKPSTGLVGMARKDGVAGAHAILQYLDQLPPAQPAVLQQIRACLNSLPKPVVHQVELERIEAAEHEIALQQHLESFKFSKNEEMLAADVETVRRSV